MRIMLFLSFVFAIFVSFDNAFAYQELIYDRFEGKNVNVIRVVLDGEHYVVSSVALTGGDSLENLTEKRPGSVASINGVFFCPDDYSQCNKTHTISDRVFMGNGKDYTTYWPDTGPRAIFGFDQDGEPLFVQNNMGFVEGMDTNFNADRINDLFFGLGNRPVILYNGQDALRGSEMHFDRKIRSRKVHAFICTTEDEDEVFMGTVRGSTIYELPDFLRKYFGCFNAINLDAGNSLGLIHEDRVLRRAKRDRIMDAFVVVTRNGYEVMTNHIPPTKKPYQGNEYQMTQEDYDLADLIYDKVNELIQSKKSPIYRSKIRKAIIGTLYRSFEVERVINNPRSKKVLQEVLIKMSTIDTL